MVSQVTKVYEAPVKVEALRGVSLAIAQGRLTAIMGRSGAGKSTLLYCMAGLELPTSGTITVDGQTLSSMKERQLIKFRRESVGFVFASNNLLPTLAVAENIRLPFSIKKESVDQGWYDQVVTTLHLSDLLGQKPGSLTAGQQQRVALARALVTKPAVIFADEPTGNLDSESTADVLSSLRSCVTELGQTVVMATHDPAAAARADYVYVMDDGSIMEKIESPTLNRMIDAVRSLSDGLGA